jgi:hypothetical protein
MEKCPNIGVQSPFLLIHQQLANYPSPTGFLGREFTIAH